MAVNVFAIEWLETYFKNQPNGFVIDVGAGRIGIKNE